MSIIKNYQYHNLTIQVNTSQSSHHLWLQEFLCPYFEIVNQDNYDCQIILRENNSEYSQIYEQYSTVEHNVIDCFIMDSKVISFPSGKIKDHELAIFNEKHSIFFLVNLDSKKITLLTTINNKKIRVSIMHIMRELAMNSCMNEGGLFIHGSAFSLGNKGIIMAGQKGAGKTTLLLHSLTHPQTNYLSNDRVLVYFNNDTIIFRGMPTITSILPSSFDYFPEYKNKLLSTSYRTSLTINEANQLNITPKPNKSGKFALSPAQFFQIFNVSPIAEVEGWKLIFPQVTDTIETFDFKKLSPYQSQKLLSQSLFGGYTKQDKKSIFNINKSNNNNSVETLDILCNKLLNKIDSYQCIMGNKIYKKDQKATKFVEHCLQY